MPMRIASGYEALAGEVLAAFAVRAEAQTGIHAGKILHSSNPRLSI